jgi:hypothetical protein
VAVLVGANFRSSSLAVYSLTLDAGSYALTGTAATLAQVAINRYLRVGH